MHTIEEIAALLHIHEKAHAHGNLLNISGAALSRLRQINEEMQPDGLGGPNPKVAEPPALAAPEEPPVATEEEPNEEETEEPKDAA